MKTKIISIVIITLFKSVVMGQMKESVDIRFLTAKFSDTSNTKFLDAIFLISTLDTIDFPPTLVLPPKCTVFENGREKVVLLQPQNLGVELFDKKIVEKNKRLYALIKESIDIKTFNNKKNLIICYSIKGLNYVFKRMSLTPSFKAKHNKEMSINKRFEFDVN